MSQWLEWPSVKVTPTNHKTLLAHAQYSLPDHGPDAGVRGQGGLQRLRLEPLVQDLYV